MGNHQRWRRCRSLRLAWDVGADLAFLHRGLGNCCGVINIVEAIRLRKQIDGEWLMILIGVWGIIFGIVTFAWPGATALAIVWVIGIYAIVLGVIEIILSFKVKGRGKSPQAQPA